MSIVHFVDTSILTELLNIPNMASSYEAVKAEYEELSTRGDSFVFPAAVLVETGNHIAHVNDGTLRWQIATKFTALISKAIAGESDMSVIPEITIEELESIINKFPDQARAAIGFGDTSIVEQFDRYWRTKQPIGEMRIWSKDEHLSAYHQFGGLARRKNI